MVHNNWFRRVALCKIKKITSVKDRVCAGVDRRAYGINPRSPDAEDRTR